MSAVTTGSARSRLRASDTKCCGRLFSSVIFSMCCVSDVVRRTKRDARRSGPDIALAGLMRREKQRRTPGNAVERRAILSRKAKAVALRKHEVIFVRARHIETSSE